MNRDLFKAIEKIKVEEQMNDGEKTENELFPEQEVFGRYFIQQIRTEIKDRCQNDPDQDIQTNDL